MNTDAIYEGLTREDIFDLPTLMSIQFDDLKREDVHDEDHVRVWVSRVEFMPDGKPQITIEKLIDGEWEVEGFY